MSGLNIVILYQKYKNQETQANNVPSKRTATKNESDGMDLFVICSTLDHPNESPWRRFYFTRIRF